jgi:hypothetical protein
MILNMNGGPRDKTSHESRRAIAKVLILDRQESKETQKQRAKRAQISVATLRKLEKGSYVCFAQHMKSLQWVMNPERYRAISVLRRGLNVHIEESPFRTGARFSWQSRCSEHSVPQHLRGPLESIYSLVNRGPDGHVVVMTLNHVSNLAVHLGRSRSRSGGAASVKRSKQIATSDVEQFAKALQSLMNEDEEDVRWEERRQATCDSSAAHDASGAESRR